MCRPSRGSPHRSPLPAGTVRAERFVLGSHCAMPGQGRTEQNRYPAAVKPRSFPICSVFAHLPLQLPAHVRIYHGFIRLLCASSPTGLAKKRLPLPGAAQSAATHPQLSARRLFAPGTDPLRSLVALQPSGRAQMGAEQRGWGQGAAGKRSARLAATAAPLPLTTPRALPARGWDYSAPSPPPPGPLGPSRSGPALTTCRAAAGRGPGTRPPPPPP